MRVSMWTGREVQSEERSGVLGLEDGDAEDEMVMTGLRMAVMCVGESVVVVAVVVAAEEDVGEPALLLLLVLLTPPLLCLRMPPVRWRPEVVNRRRAGRPCEGESANETLRARR